MAYDPTDPHVSSIFVVDCHTWKQMSPAIIQDVFRYCHILVSGVENEQMAFDLAGLATLVWILLPRFVQGESDRLF